MTNTEHPLFDWLKENEDNIERLRQDGYTKAAAVQIILLFDLCTFCLPDDDLPS